MPGLNVKQEDIDQFVAITQASPEDAEHFLNAGTTLEIEHRLTIQGAIEDFYAAQNAAGSTDPTESSSLLDTDMSDQTPNTNTNDAPTPAGGPRTLGGQAADAALPAGWGQKKKTLGRIGDWGGESSAGQGSRGGRSDDDDDEEDDGKKGETLFAGGEKSGLAVQAPDQPGTGRGPRGIVENILKQAAQGSKSREEAQAAPSSSNPFRGSGNTLGDDETPSAPVGQPAPARAGQGAAGGASSLLRSLLGGYGGGGQGDEEEDEEEEVTRRLTFWSNGFSIEDGDLYRYDEPGNKDLLEAIQAGRAPPSLFGVKFGQPLKLEVAQRTNEEYQQPPKVLKPFGGGGNRLGSPAPEVSAGSSSTGTSGGSMPGGILSGGASSSSSSAPPTNAPSSAPKFEVDSSKPITSIQVRLGDGTKLVAKVNLTHTVADLRNFVSAARPDNRPFVLQTTFPSKELSDHSQTIEEAKLQNAVVVQRFT